MSDTVIKIDHVYKEYRLGAIGGTTLRDDLHRLSAKLRGKADPTLKIGENASHRNERFFALNDVSFEVKQGEALGIIGHNGAGKSTLLKLLSRVTAPTKGTISYNGRIASMLEVGTGFHGELTGRENVYMNGAILGMKKAEIDRKMDDIIAFAEMEQFIDTPVKRYSSGMYVKLAFSVAAHLDSEIMIMDEVLAVGDMKFQQKCLGKMGDAANNQGKTVLYVSHNMNTIRQLCNRVIVMEAGRVIFDGDTEKAISLYMGKNLNTDTYVNLEEYKRLSFLQRTDVRLMSAEYSGKSDTVFYKGEPMNIRFKWKNNKDVKNLGFRMVVYGSDDTHLCASFAYDMYTGKRNAITTADMSFDISSLAPGDYQSYYVFFLINEFGTTEDIDQVKGLCFTVDDSKIHGKLQWRTKAWGHIELPPPDITIQENQKG